MMPGEFPEDVTGADLIRRISAAAQEMEAMLDDESLALEELAGFLADMMVSLAVIGATITSDTPPRFLAGITLRFLQYETQSQVVLDFKAYLDAYMKETN